MVIKCKRLGILKPDPLVHSILEGLLLHCSLLLAIFGDFYAVTNLLLVFISPFLLMQSNKEEEEEVSQTHE